MELEANLGRHRSVSPWRLSTKKGSNLCGVAQIAADPPLMERGLVLDLLLADISQYVDKPEVVAEDEATSRHQVKFSVLNSSFSSIIGTTVVAVDVGIHLLEQHRCISLVGLLCQRASFLKQDFRRNSRRVVGHVIALLANLLASSPRVATTTIICSQQSPTHLARTAVAKTMVQFGANLAQTAPGLLQVVSTCVPMGSACHRSYFLCAASNSEN